MSNPSPRRNRGPAAAAENHQSLLAAARALFAERGYQVPMQAIAQRAGVGQGVLYRHFPTRLDLAFAVFEENFVELERVAAEPGDDTFITLWRRLVELMLDAEAFVEMVVEARRTFPDYDGGRRMTSLMDGPLRRAQAAGLVDPSLAAADVMLALGMVYGAVATNLPEERAAAASRAREFIERVFLAH